jgi:SAM-dependent methyltransferase
MDLPAIADALFRRRPRCPVCGWRRFYDRPGRPRADCAGCRTLERGRAVWLCLERLGLLRSGLAVLHVAPEPGIARRLHALCGERYHPADVDPSQYRHLGLPVRPLDLCRDLGRVADGAYDLVLHNHVLEHIPCAIEPVLMELDRIVRPGGWHLFTVPIGGERTVEDLAPDLTPAERMTRFHQADHMRLFGARDFVELLQRLWGLDGVAVGVADLCTPAELRRAAVPSAAGRIDGHTVFRRRKPAAPVSASGISSAPA